MIKTSKRDNALYKEYFVKIYDSFNNEFKGYKLKQSDKLLLGFICHGAMLHRVDAEWNKPLCNWSNSVLADNCGITERQVRDSLNNLEKAGIIRRRHQKNSKNILLLIDVEKDKTFIKMYTKVTRNKDFTLNDKFVYTVIHSYCMNKGFHNKCFTNNSMIAKRVNCTPNTVRNSVKKLEKLGYLEIEQTKSGAREITIKKDLWIVKDTGGDIGKL